MDQHPFMGYNIFYWTILIIIFIFISVLIYNDAKKRGKEGLMWAIIIMIPVILFPMIGIFSAILSIIIIIIYLVSVEMAK